MYHSFVHSASFRSAWQHSCPAMWTWTADRWTN